MFECVFEQIVRIFVVGVPQFGITHGIVFVGNCLDGLEYFDSGKFIGFIALDESTEFLMIFIISLVRSLLLRLILGFLLSFEYVSGLKRFFLIWFF